MQEIVAPPGEAAKKLENFLKKRFPIGYVGRLFRKNGVRLNGQRSSRESIVRPGDRIQLYIPFAESSRAVGKGGAATVELEILFEDHDVLVVNKPAGWVVHEGRKILKRDSIIGLLEAKYRRANIAPQLVHRLDRDTSGLLVVAKSEQAAKELEALFEHARVHKDYLCLVTGRLQENTGRIEFPLPGREGKPVRAVTRFKIEKKFSQTTLVRVNIETGRMHQIRLHFSKLGYPVVMDNQHGDFDFNRHFRKQYGLRRQFLHARGLSLEFRGTKYTWSAPLPDDLKTTLEALARMET